MIKDPLALQQINCYNRLASYLGDGAPSKLTFLGNAEILEGPSLALLCSTKCPGSLILKTYDLACEWRDAKKTVISGFHSPMEKECLKLLLRGTQPVIIFPARTLEGMRIYSEWREPLNDGRLLLLSPFETGQRRVTADSAQRRNKFVGAMADEIFVAYASPRGKTEQFCRTIMAWGKPLFTIPGEENANLMTLGAQGITLSKIR